MIAKPRKKAWMPGARRMIQLEFCEVLSEVMIDNFFFKATLSPVEDGGCILWFREDPIQGTYEALGKFQHFDKRLVLEFIMRYATNPDLRNEIDRRRFESRVDSLPPAFFWQIEMLAEEDKETAFRELFDLDDIIESRDIAIRRRIMARKFHPDAGGDPQAMTLINEAYEFLRSRADS